MPWFFVVSVTVMSAPSATVVADVVRPETIMSGLAGTVRSNAIP